jgi:hypothetical protein
MEKDYLVDGYAKTRMSPTNFIYFYDVLEQDEVDNDDS